MISQVWVRREAQTPRQIGSEYLYHYFLLYIYIYHHLFLYGITQLRLRLGFIQRSLLETLEGPRFKHHLTKDMAFRPRHQTPETAHAPE